MIDEALARRLKERLSAISGEVLEDFFSEVQDDSTFLFLTCRLPYGGQAEVPRELRSRIVATLNELIPGGVRSGAGKLATQYQPRSRRAAPPDSDRSSTYSVEPRACCVLPDGGNCPRRTDGELTFRTPWLWCWPSFRPSLRLSFFLPTLGWPTVRAAPSNPSIERTSSGKPEAADQLRLQGLPSLSSKKVPW
jgi:hypothetical protein